MVDGEVNSSSNPSFNNKSKFSGKRKAYIDHFKQEDDEYDDRGYQLKRVQGDKAQNPPKPSD